MGMEEEEESAPFFVPTKFTYHENGSMRNYELNFIQKIFVLFSYPKSSVCSAFLSNLEKGAIILNLIVYIISWQGMLLVTPSSCPNPVCSNDSLCQNHDICPPVVASELLIIQIICTGFFAIIFLIQAGTSVWVPARLAEVLYPVPDAYLTPPPAPRASHSPSHSVSIDGKPRRRASLIGDRITTTEEGKSNWNSIQQLQSTIQIDPIYAWHITLSRYLCKTRSVIQIVTTFPMILTFIFCYNNYQPDLWYINVSRILQLTELFKLQSYQRAMKVLSNTLLHTYKIFFFLYWFIMLLVIFFGSIMFAAERGEFTVNSDHPHGAYLRWNIERTEKEVSPFRSLAVAMWYALVSITTVGYGDIVPTTVAGRAIGAFLLLLAMVIIALPITVIGEAFANAVDEYNNDKIKTKAESRNSNTKQTFGDLLRDSLISTDENIETKVTSFNPLRRSFIRRPGNRSSTRLGNTSVQDMSSQNGDEQERQQERIDQWIECLEQTDTRDTNFKQLLELQFELYQNNLKMKELENEYLNQIKSLNEIQTELFDKIQNIMKLLSHQPPSPPSPPPTTTPQSPSRSRENQPNGGGAGASEAEYEDPGVEMKIKTEL